MSQSQNQHALPGARRLASARVARASASTAAGLAAQRVTLAARDRARHTSRVRMVAQALDEAARSDAAAERRPVER
jgi:hypothetical protein